MKKVLFVLAIAVLSVIQVKAQTEPGPVEKKLMDSLCVAISKVDLSKISTKEEANTAFMNCFATYSYMLLDVANERGVEASDTEAMHKIGLAIGMNLVRQKCTPFVKLAALMAGSANKTDVEGSTQGTVKRIENKGFNYIVVTDASGNEKSFLWLRQFAGSEKFAGLPATYINKKVRVKWQNMEVYLPQAKGYYNVKEITGVEML